MRGKYLVTLNTHGRPIAQKYREGKMQRTLKRELKEPETDVWEAIWIYLDLPTSGVSSV